MRSEGDEKSTGDVAVDEAYDGTGATFDFYWDVFRRDSIDDAGLPLLSTVHYGARVRQRVLGRLADDLR